MANTTATGMANWIESALLMERSALMKATSALQDERIALLRERIAIQEERQQKPCCAQLYRELVGCYSFISLEYPSLMSKLWPFPKSPEPPLQTPEYSTKHSKID